MFFFTAFFSCSPLAHTHLKKSRFGSLNWLSIQSEHLLNSVSSENIIKKNKQKTTTEIHRQGKPPQRAFSIYKDKTLHKEAGMIGKKMEQIYKLKI